MSTIEIRRRPLRHAPPRHPLSDSLRTLLLESASATRCSQFFLWHLHSTSPAGLRDVLGIQRLLQRVTQRTPVEVTPCRCASGDLCPKREAGFHGGGDERARRPISKDSVMAKKEGHVS